MRFTTDDKHIIKWMWVKKICRKKTLAQDAWSLDVLQRHWSKYQCEIFNFVDLCSGVGIVWLTTTQTWVNDAAAVTFSFKCFNTLKLSSRKHLQKVVCFIHFIYSQAFNNNVIFNSKSYSKNTFTDVRFTSLLANDIYRVTTLQTMWNSLTIPWQFVTLLCSTRHVKCYSYHACTSVTFAVAAARVWNSLPATLTSQPSLLMFRRQLKTLLFEQSFS